MPAMQSTHSVGLKPHCCGTGQPAQRKHDISSASQHRFRATSFTRKECGSLCAYPSSACHPCSFDNVLPPSARALTARAEQTWRRREPEAAAPHGTAPQASAPSASSRRMREDAAAARRGQCVCTAQVARRSSAGWRRVVRVSTSSPRQSKKSVGRSNLRRPIFAVN
jgi:hypothetical protein